MNKAEKNKNLFSSGGVFVDIFIGFLIAACIAGVVYRCFIYDPHARDEAGESYMVFFEVENAQRSFASYLQSGDHVYDESTGCDSVHLRRTRSIPKTALYLWYKMPRMCKIPCLSLEYSGLCRGR